MTRRLVRTAGHDQIQEGALGALALAATALVTSALAAAAEPEPTPANDLAWVDFNATEYLNFFGFREIEFKCSDFNGGEYPYVALDKYLEPNITYFTGDGANIGHYFGDIAPHGLVDPSDPLLGPLVGVHATVSPEHKAVRFFCANTLQAANQRR